MKQHLPNLQNLPMPRCSARRWSVAATAVSIMTRPAPIAARLWPAAIARPAGSAAMCIARCCTWPRNSEHCYGSARVFMCSFVIRCFNSLKLSRCLECDCSRDCTGAYFCHNCENVHDSMFCFNAKNLRYAIGNAEVGREAFERAKKMLLSEIAASLEKTHDYKRSIYNISGKGN